MRIGKSKHCILLIILKICEKHNKTYCWPTRMKVQELLRNFYKIDISLSAIDYHLGTLKQYKYIKSFKRTGRKQDGTMYNLPSNRQLTIKGVMFLLTLSVRVAKYLISWVKSGVCPVWSNKHTNSGKPQSTYIPKRLRTATACN